MIISLIAATVNKSTTKNTTYSTPKDRLVAFYTSHCPDKLPKVDKNLRKYSGREEVLWGMLYRKYKEKFKYHYYGAKN